MPAQRSMLIPIRRTIPRWAFPTAAVPTVTQLSLSLTLLHPPDKNKHFRTEEIMRAFVTGSTGLLGNNLVRTLHQAGHEVWALARSKEKAQQTLGDMAARIIIGDLRNVAEFAPCLKGVDVVFHTAAYFREYYNPGDHSNAVEFANVKGTMELAQAAHAMGVGKMVHTSSAGIVGLQADGSPGDERTPPWPGAARNLYLNSKR